MEIEQQNETDPDQAIPETIPWPEDPVECCRRFFSEIEIAPKPNKRIGTSYFLKHVVESVNPLSYVPMESLLQAATECGVPMLQCWDGCPNYYLAITTKSLRAFMQRNKIRGVV